MNGVLKSVKYLPYLLIHPFDGFYEAKYGGKGSLALSTFLFALYGMSRIVIFQYRGFIINNIHLYDLESTEMFLSGALPAALFMISNYAATALMNGSGKFRHIYMVVCYSLTPLIFFTLVSAAVSRLLILEEIPLLAAFYYIGIIWFLFLLFAGLCVVHEYQALQNIASLLLTVVAAVIILFLLVLLLTLVNRMSGFFGLLFSEAVKRWRR